MSGTSAQRGDPSASGQPGRVIDIKKKGGNRESRASRWINTRIRGYNILAHMWQADGLIHISEDITY